MAFPRRAAAIVGVYTTRQARSLAETSYSLQLEAMKGALDDAGLTLADVDGVIPFDRSAYNTSPFAAQTWATQLGGRALTFAEPGSPTTGIPKAALAISAGLCNVVVAFWGKAGWKLGPGGTSVPISPRGSPSGTTPCSAGATPTSTRSGPSGTCTSSASMVKTWLRWRSPIATTPP